MKRMLIVIAVVVVVGAGLVISGVVDVGHHPSPSPSSQPSEEEEEPPEPPTPTVVVDSEQDYQLGLYAQQRIPLQLKEGDKFSGHVTVRRELTVALEIWDPKGSNHGPSECVQYWPWDLTVPVGQGGRWVIYVENTKWLGFVDVTLSYKVVQNQ